MALASYSKGPSTGEPTKIGIPRNGYINPNQWKDDQPLLFFLTIEITNALTMAYMTLIRFFMKTSGLVQLVPRIKVRGQKHDLDET